MSKDFFFLKNILNFTIFCVFSLIFYRPKEHLDLESDFKEALSLYNKENHRSGSVDFDKKCYQLFNIINTPTHRYKTILITGSPGSGKTSIIEATANILAKHQRINFFLNWIDLDSTPSVLVLGGQYENTRIQGLIPIFVEIAINDMKQSELLEYQYIDLIRHW